MPPVRARPTLRLPRWPTRPARARRRTPSRPPTAAVQGAGPGSMQDARNGKDEFRYRHLEGRPIGADALIAAAHRSVRRAQWASAGVFERLARRQPRLLADDAGTADLLDLAVSVRDDPVARNKLCGGGARVFHADGIGEKIDVRARIGLLCDEPHAHAHGELMLAHGMTFTGLDGPCARVCAW